MHKLTLAQFEVLETALSGASQMSRMLEADSRNNWMADDLRRKATALVNDNLALLRLHEHMTLGEIVTFIESRLNHETTDTHRS